MDVNNEGTVDLAKWKKLFVEESNMTILNQFLSFTLSKDLTSAT